MRLLSSIKRLFAPKPARMRRVSLRAQRRTVAEREAFEATTARLRREITERRLLDAVAKAVAQ